MDYLNRLSGHSRNYYFFFFVFGYIIVVEIVLYNMYIGMEEFCLLKFNMLLSISLCKTRFNTLQFFQIFSVFINGGLRVLQFLLQNTLLQESMSQISECAGKYLRINKKVSETVLACSLGARSSFKGKNRKQTSRDTVPFMKKYKSS